MTEDHNTQQGKKMNVTRWGFVRWREELVTLDESHTAAGGGRNCGNSSLGFLEAFPKHSCSKCQASTMDPALF